MRLTRNLFYSICVLGSMSSLWISVAHGDPIHLSNTPVQHETSQQAPLHLTNVPAQTMPSPKTVQYTQNTPVHLTNVPNTLTAPAPQHLTNMPTQGTAMPKNRQKAGKGVQKTAKGQAKKGEIHLGNATAVDPKIVEASRQIDEWLKARQNDPFYKTHAAILKKLGPQLIQSGVPPEYWKGAFAFAYAALAVQTQQLMKTLQQLETIERIKYEKALSLHNAKPRLIPKPQLNLEPLYALRHQLLELSAIQ